MDPISRARINLLLALASSDVVTLRDAVAAYRKAVNTASMHARAAETPTGVQLLRAVEARLDRIEQDARREVARLVRLRSASRWTWFGLLTIGVSTAISLHQGANGFDLALLVGIWSVAYGLGRLAEPPRKVTK